MKKSVADRLRELVEKGTHPSDIASELENFHPEDVARAILGLPVEKAAEIVDHMDDDFAADVMEHLPSDFAADLLERMPIDDAADVLGEMQPALKDRVLESVEEKEARSLKKILEYPEDTVGHLMTEDFISVFPNMTCQETIDRLRELAPSPETAYYVYVTDKEGKLLGVISLRDLVVSPPDRRIGDILRKDVVVLHPDDDREKAAKVFEKYGFVALPVVSEEGKLLGVVTVDDIVEVVHEESEEDLLKFAGTTEEEQQIMTVTTWDMVRGRIPWLVISLIAELFSGKVINHFSPLIAKVISLTVFIPLIMALGGNAGNQSAAVVIMALARGEEKTALKVVRKGIASGAILGAFIGLLLFGVTLMSGNVALATTVGVSSGLVITIAAIWGGLFPILMHRVGVDPAYASAPFISALNDVLGLAVYFSVAIFILRLFGRGV